MAERETLTKEQLLERAWQRWFEEDFSWDGLAEKKIGGDGGLHGEETLQDYWRRDPETGEIRSDEQMRDARELVELDGVLWHIVHFPSRDRKGEPTWKADLDHEKWTEVERLIDRRVADGQATEGRIDDFGEEEISGSDGRAQLAGAVMRRPPRLSGPLEGPGQAAGGAAMHLSARYAFFLGTADFSKVEFGSPAYFFSATFSANAYFFSATFSAAATFSSATFSAAANFFSATFSADANFYSAIFSANAYFFSATFSAAAYFSSATFSDDADFIFATFSADTTFSSATFSADARFFSATFSADAYFYSATFSANAYFRAAAFHKAHFRFTRFEKDAWFTRLSKEEPVKFAKLGDFSNAQFEGVAHFAEARFDGVMRFKTARFMQFADFRGVFGPAREADWRRAFDGAIAFGTLDWRRLTSENAPPSEQSDRNGAYHMISAFAGAKLKEGIYYPAPGEGAAEKIFTQKALQPACDAGWRVWRQGNPRERRVSLIKHAWRRFADLPSSYREERDRALAALESGAQVLKLAMDDAKDNLREQRFYRFELIARRKQSATKWPETTFSWLFGLSADYGGSVLRPLLVLLGLFGLFGLIYYSYGASILSEAIAPASGVATRQPPSWTGWHAAAFSMQQIFRPFGVWWTLSPADQSVAAQFMRGFNVENAPAHQFWIRVLATIQSIFAVVFLFLFVLAMRRRFQMD